MDLSTHLGNTEEGAFPLSKLKSVQHQRAEVGYIAQTSAGLRTLYVSERYRSQGHRYEKQNAYAVSESLLSSSSLQEVTCIGIVDYDEHEAYIYTRDLFKRDASESVLLTWEDTQIAVPVAYANTVALPDSVWNE